MTLEAKDDESAEGPAVAAAEASPSVSNAASAWTPLTLRPDVSCAGYKLRIDLTERESGLWEEVSAGLFSGNKRVAKMRGTYIMRPARTAVGFYNASTAGLGPHAVNDVPFFFEENGELLPAIAAMLGAQAQEHGLFFLRDMQLARQLRGKDLGLDFTEAVVKCLSGPMKRVTLAACMPVPTLPLGKYTTADAAVLALERHMCRIGFARPRPESGLLLLEPKARSTRLCREEAARLVQATVASVADGEAPAVQQAEGQRKVEQQHRETEREKEKENSPPRKRGRQHQHHQRQQQHQQRQMQQQQQQHQPRRQLVAANHAYSSPLEAENEDFICFRRSPMALSLEPSGSLTPWIREALLASCQAGAEALQTDIERFEGGVRGKRFWGAASFTEKIQSLGVFRVFLRGITVILELSRAMVRQGVLPTVGTLEAALEPPLPPKTSILGHQLGLSLDRHAVSHFIGNGGRPVHVVEAMIAEATQLHADGLLKVAPADAGPQENEDLSRGALDSDGLRRLLLQP